VPGARRVCPEWAPIVSGVSIIYLVSVHEKERFWGRFRFEKVNEMGEKLRRTLEGYGEGAILLKEGV
jgi:hypothetical protein